MAEFSGFPRDLFKFLEDLKQNNNRAWFNERKARYFEAVVNPMSEFILAMRPRLKKLSKHYVADPRPHGGSMFRIYRDTRFSNDKTPYKTHAACHFRHEAGKNAHAPGFYVHLDSNYLDIGGGIWRPPSPHLAKIRDSIADNARAWARIANAKKVKEAGGIKGETLKRPPRGFDAKHVHIDHLKRKSFYVMMRFPVELAHQPEMVDQVEDAFRRAAPLNRFVCDAIELPF